MGSIEDFTSSTSGTTKTISPLSDGALNDPIFSDDVIRYHLSLLKSGHGGEVVSDESAYAPIISSSVLACHANLGNGQDKPKIPQFGLLAGSRPLLQDLRPKRASPIASLDKDPRLLFNVSHPSSVFICGSQGSGKSHTLSCLLENCLIPSKAGRLPNPLTGLVFHYDTFISDTVGSPCEASFLSSHPDVHVRLVPLKQRLDTLESFMPQEQVQMSRTKERKVTKSSIWDPVVSREFISSSVSAKASSLVA
ncbi:unnamed protein product [Aspergillus oryzae]|nr:unnamed protein product [Aspergillus oryzae]